MLMMVDPHVHFHVIPRYQNAPEFASVTTTDSDWPGPPDLTKEIEFDQQQLMTLLNYLRNAWVA